MVMARELRVQFKNWIVSAIQKLPSKKWSISAIDIVLMHRGEPEAN